MEVRGRETSADFCQLVRSHILSEVCVCNGVAFALRVAMLLECE